MKLQMKVEGLKALNRDLQAVVNTMVAPQAGIADALEEGLQVTVDRARRHVWELFDTSGDFPSRIGTRKVNQYRVDLYVNAVYAAVHEYGGTFTVTPRQRAFFWHKWNETGDEMWKALALSVTYTIPPRPYLRPAIDETRSEAMRDTAWALRQQLAKQLRRQ